MAVVWLQNLKKMYKLAEVMLENTNLKIDKKIYLIIYRQKCYTIHLDSISNCMDKGYQYYSRWQYKTLGFDFQMKIVDLETL